MMNPTENRRIHALLREACIDSEQRRELIWHMTEGRTSSMRQLSGVEVEAFMKFILIITRQKRQQCDKLRKTIIAMGYQCGWKVPKTKAWCEKHGAGGKKKKFNSYNASELMKIIKTMEVVKVEYGIGTSLQLNTLNSRLN